MSTTTPRLIPGPASTSAGASTAAGSGSPNEPIRAEPVRPQPTERRRGGRFGRLSELMESRRARTSGDAPRATFRARGTDPSASGESSPTADPPWAQQQANYGPAYSAYAQPNPAQMRYGARGMRGLGGTLTAIGQGAAALAVGVLGVTAATTFGLLPVLIGVAAFSYIRRAHQYNLAYGGMGPYGGMNAYGGTGPYGQMDPYGRMNPYGQMDPYGRMNPYGQMDPYGRMNPYGQMDPYGRMSPYGQMDPYDQMDAYGRMDPYSQMDPYAQMDDANPGMPPHGGMNAHRPPPHPQQAWQTHPSWQPQQADLDDDWQQQMARNQAWQEPDFYQPAQQQADATSQAGAAAQPPPAQRGMDPAPMQPHAAQTTAPSRPEQAVAQPRLPGVSGQPRHARAEAPQRADRPPSRPRHAKPAAAPRASDADTGALGDEADLSVNPGGGNAPSAFWAGGNGVMPLSQRFSPGVHRAEAPSQPVQPASVNPSAMPGSANPGGVDQQSLWVPPPLDVPNPEGVNERNGRNEHNGQSPEQAPPIENGTGVSTRATHAHEYASAGGLLKV